MRNVYERQASVVLWLVFCLSPQKPELDRRSVNVDLCWEKWHSCFSLVTLFSHVSFILQMLGSHFRLNATPNQEKRTKPGDARQKNYTILCFEEHFREKYFDMM